MIPSVAQRMVQFLNDSLHERAVAVSIFDKDIEWFFGQTTGVFRFEFV